MEHINTPISSVSCLNVENPENQADQYWASLPKIQIYYITYYIHYILKIKINWPKQLDFAIQSGLALHQFQKKNAVKEDLSKEREAEKNVSSRWIFNLRCFLNQNSTVLISGLFYEGTINCFKSKKIG